jgi:predicted phosphodiesterase
MPSKSYQTDQYIIPYLKEYPNTPTLTLARMIYKEHPDDFSSIEHVRDFLRYYRHAVGKRSRKNIGSDEFKRLNGDDYRGWSGFRTESVDFKDYHIPLVHKKTLLISDVHIPYHDQDALMVALNYAASARVDSVILNGDIIDFFQLSKFCRDPRKRNVQYEIDMLYEFFCIIQAILGEVKIFYKQGNHEQRLETYLMIKAPEIFGMEEFELPILAKFSDFGIEWIDKKRIILFEKLAILHGHEFFGFTSAVNPARGLYLKSKKSAIVGHHHQSSEHSEPDLHGKPVGCWSIGCLSYLHPEYSPINRWNHGFAILTRDNGTFNVENRRIYKNKLL